MNKKIIILLIIVLGAILAISIILYMNQHLRHNMNFDIMRNTTDEENKNNAANYGTMVADENYICFYNIGDKKGLVCYDIKQDEYSVIDSQSDRVYNGLQIYDGWLYYEKYDIYNQYGDGDYKVNLKTKNKELIRRGNMNPRNFFQVCNPYILSYNSNLVRIADGKETELTSAISGFTTLDGYVYYDEYFDEDYYKEYKKFPDYVNIVKQNIANPEDRTIIKDSEFTDDVFKRFFVHDNKIYVVSHNLFVIENDVMKKVENVSFQYEPNIVFYSNFIIANDEIYDSNWNLISRIEYKPDQEKITTKDFLNIKLEPQIVGGNLYIYCEEPIKINLPEVGEGWYKLDIEKYLSQHKLN